MDCHAKIEGIQYAFHPMIENKIITNMRLNYQLKVLEKLEKKSLIRS